MRQCDLDLVKEQLSDMPAEVLEIYACAALELLNKNGSIVLSIEDAPYYSKELEREATKEVTVRVENIWS